MYLKTNERKKRQKQLQRRFEIRLVTITLAIATTIGILEMWFFHSSTKGEASSRANLSVHVVLAKPIAVGQPVALVATVKNLGGSEARDLTVRSGIASGNFSDVDASEQIPLFHQSDARLIFAPGESLVEDLTGAASVSSEEYQNAMNGKLKIYFLSHLTYSDALGVPHQQKVCQYLDPSTSAMVLCHMQMASN